MLDRMQVSIYNIYDTNESELIKYINTVSYTSILGFSYCTLLTVPVE